MAITKNVIPLEKLLHKSWPTLRRPAVKNIDAALIAYYGSDGYIDNKAIQEIFGFKRCTSASMLRLQVRQVEIDNDIPMVVPNHVNVRVAFAVWGIDPDELESRRQKLIKLGLYKNEN